MNKSINFINSNGLDNSYLLNDLNDLYLSGNNPRFTLMESFNNDLMAFIKNNTFTNTQMKIFKKLLLSEDDFSDLRRLFKSIEDNQFDSSNEPLILIYDESSKKFVVAEGNRRVMCLKIIFDELYLNNFDSLFIQQDGYSNENSEKIDLMNDTIDEYPNENDITERAHKNFHEIKKTINIIRKKISKGVKFNVHYEVISDSAGLWKLIYDKHLTGERPGMRKWSRSKYFADLLNVFKDGIIDKNAQTMSILRNINREFDVVVADFKSAQFVYACFYYSGTTLENDDEHINFRDKNILSEMIHSKNISALEQTHSYNKIRKIICDEILMIDVRQFSEKYSSINYEKINNRIILSSYKLDLKKLLPFIFENWKNGVITTRPIKKSDMFILVGNLRLILKNINIENKMSINDINKLNEFELSIKQLEVFISVQKLYYTDDILLRFKMAYKIKTVGLNLNLTIETKITKMNIETLREQPMYVFEILKNQMVHNYSDKIFLNAIFVSVRSFFEQLVVWGNCVSCDKTKFRERIKNISTGRICEIFGSIRKEFAESESKQKIFLQKIILNGENNIEFVNIQKYFAEIIKDEKWHEIINENIHASHRVYVKASYNSNLLKFQNFSELVLKIFNEIDFHKLLDINYEIKKIIDADNLN